MRYRLLSPLLVAMLVLTSIETVPLFSAQPRSTDTAASLTAAGTAASPLPGGCIRVIPPGEEEPPCCISGFIYMDGEAVAGAEVEITTERNAQVKLFTQFYSGAEPLPHYCLSLSAPPLNVLPGEKVTITTRYSAHQQTVAYTVQRGGQQVDLVLSRTQPDDFMYARQLQHPNSPGVIADAEDIAIDSDGNVYVLDSRAPRVHVFAPDGQLLRAWGSYGHLPGQFSNPTAIALDLDRNVYIVDGENHRVQKFSANGAFLTSWGGFGAGPGQLRTPRAIAVDRFGFVYIADSGNQRIQKFSSVGAWIMSWETWGVDNARLDHPTGIALRPARDDYDVYVVDGATYQIHQFTSQGRWIRSWGEHGEGDGQFMWPDGIAVNSKDHVFVGDRYSAPIQEFSSTGEFVEVWEQADLPPFIFIDPAGLVVDEQDNLYITGHDLAHKFSPQKRLVRSWGKPDNFDRLFSINQALTVDHHDNVFVADLDRILKFRRTGEFIDVWEMRTGVFEDFSEIAEMTVDSSGAIYVVDSMRHQVRKYSNDGIPRGTWGGKGTADGLFDTPQGVAIDREGNVYVADSGNHRIQKFTSAGIWQASWNVWSGDKKARPTSLATDQANHVYMVDRDNHQIQKFTSSGQLLTVWGGLGSGKGKLNRPSDIAVDSRGYVYVADDWNNRVQMFSSDGEWRASWGNPGAGPDDPFVYAKLIALDSSDNLYTGTRFNKRIQILHPMHSTRPTATISYLSNTSLNPDDTLIAYGSGQDSDDTPAITAYRWTSDRDGLLGATPTLTRAAATLSPGSHRLSLDVQDNEGEWSSPITADIFVAAPATPSWTMLLYLAGDYQDNESLSRAYAETLSRLRTQFYNPFVRIAVQIDGPAVGDTRRLLILPGSGATPPQITNLPYGERDMDNPDRLADFIRWGQENFRADNYYLAIADHGQAIQGIAWDHVSDPNDGAYLTAKEIGAALGSRDIDHIDILHLDACSMNLLEVAYELRERVGIVIASQYLAWNYFAYDSYQTQMGATTSPEEVAINITRQYAEHAKNESLPYTIAALNMQRAEPTLKAVDELAGELTALITNNPDSNHRELLQKIWRDSQKFESNGDRVNNELDMYIDLLSWAKRVRSTMTSPAVQERADQLIGELTSAQSFIIPGSHSAQSRILPGSASYIDLSGAHGLSIFYPPRPNMVVYKRYIEHTLFDFTRMSRWPQFLRAQVGDVPDGPLDPPPGPLPPSDPSPSATPTASPSISPTVTVTTSPTATRTTSPTASSTATRTASPTASPTPLMVRKFLPLAIR